MVTKTRSTPGGDAGAKAEKKTLRGTGKKATPPPKKAKATVERKPATQAPPPRRAASARKASAPKTAPKATGTKSVRAAKTRARVETAPPPPSPAAGSKVGESEFLTLRNAPLPYEIVEGEAYMGPQQKEHFRRLLEAWRRELMEEVDRTVRYMQDEAANFPDANDRATQESEFSLELRTRDRERKLIRKIDDALTRIETDEYGYCVTCGEEIGIRRLEARPIATQCIDCKERDERRERQNRGL